MNNDSNSDDFQAHFWDHIEELRGAFIKIFCIIIAGMAICLCFQEALINVLTYPLRIAEPEAKLALLSPIEGFLTALKASFWVGLIGTFPLWVYPLVKFVIPGLHAREKALIFPFLAGSIFCVGTGVGLAYFVTLPMANAYFYAYNSSIGINFWSLSSYLDFSLLLLFGHAVVFECGLILLFLVYTGLIGAEGMSNNRRLVYVCAFILGALVTPPDVPSQLMVAIPLIVMYELCLLYARVKKRSSSSVP